jgi:hypothetical protein
VSWDIYLDIDTGGPKPAQVCEVGNMTWNVDPMYVRAMGISLSELDGRIAGDVMAHLRTGLTNMEDCPDIYKEMNPPNGWGDYHSALKYLQEITHACAQHPRATIRVC